MADRPLVDGPESGAGGPRAAAPGPQRAAGQGGAAPGAARPATGTGPAPPQQRPPAALFRGKGAFWWPWPFLVALDLWSKAAVFGWMEEHYGPHHEHLVFETAPLTLHLVTWENPGTIWGLFQNGTVWLMVLRCAAVVGLLWYVRVTAARARLQLVVLSLIFAGAIGNLYDNFTRLDGDPPRSVRDFLHFAGRWPFAWDFPAFNVADACISVGAVGLLCLLLWEDRLAARAARQVSS